jgi:hypothetical protein
MSLDITGLIYHFLSSSFFFLFIFFFLIIFKIIKIKIILSYKLKIINIIINFFKRKEIEFTERKF